MTYVGGVLDVVLHPAPLPINDPILCFAIYFCPVVLGVAQPDSGGCEWFQKILYR